MHAGMNQAGMTLIEVLVALLIVSIGVLGGAMLQLDALKYTDSAMRSMQVSFLAHDLFERIRANPDGNYALASLSQAPVSGNLNAPRDQDLFDFSSQLKRMVGEDVQASVSVSGSTVTLVLDWDDSRAAQQGGHRQNLTLSSAVSSPFGLSP